MCMCMCGRVLVCICTREGSKQFQLWPWRKDVLSEDIWGSVLLQIRGLKLTATAWSKGRDIVDAPISVFSSASFPFILYTVLSYILLATSCMSCLLLNLNCSQAENILSCIDVFFPTGVKPYCICVWPTFNVSKAKKILSPVNIMKINVG